MRRRKAALKSAIQDIAAALNAEGVNALVIYKPGRVDYHIYPYWTPIMERRTWSENGGPCGDGMTGR
jgi:hypothetical protein